MEQTAKTEAPPHQTTVHQMAPPAEHESEPEMTIPTSTVVSFSMDDCPVSLEQSARVEPSPERFCTLPSCAEEEEAISPFSVASGQCIVIQSNLR